MNDQKVIFSMVGVNRVFPPNQQVIRDISLGFFYGAKIGVLGLNGSGKSTLLRIMAGRDDGYQGQVVLSKGYSVGLLEQEPALEEDKTVRQVVEEAVQLVVDLLARYDQVNEAFASVPMKFQRDMKVPYEKINVNGGAIAMGHPLGATAGMLLGTVLDGLERRDLKYGLITLCAAAGIGVAGIIERV